MLELQFSARQQSSASQVRKMKTQKKVKIHICIEITDKMEDFQSKHNLEECEPQEEEQQIYSWEIGRKK